MTQQIQWPLNSSIMSSEGSMDKSHNVSRERQESTRSNHVSSRQGTKNYQTHQANRRAQDSMLMNKDLVNDMKQTLDNR